MQEKLENELFFFKYQYEYNEIKIPSTYIL